VKEIAMSKNKHHRKHAPKISSNMLGIALTAIGSVVSIVACNIGLIGWVKADVSDVKTELREFKTEVRGWREEMHKETKDFHARLSVIEANNQSHKKENK
jgi:hypothetical protein